MGKIESRTFSAAPGGASVTLPVSSTANALARWSGTGGNSLLDSAITLSDTGEMLFTGGSGQNIRLSTSNAGDIGDSDGTNSFANITAGTMLQYASSSTNYARLMNLAANSPMLVLKSGSSNPIQLYAYTDGILYLAFNGSDRFTFNSSGNFSATNGGIAATTYLTTGSFGGAMQTVVGTDAGSSVISANIHTFYLNPAGSLSTYTITMPASPYNGMIVRITSSQVVTTLTHAANSGHTIAAPLTTLAVGSFGAWQFHSASTNWARVG